MLAAVEQSAETLAHHGRAEHLDIDGLEKDLKSKRINYVGEEGGICHKLTLEQVLPSLPPKEHGDSIDVRNFVCETTQRLLNDPRSFVEDDVGQHLPKLQGKIHIEGKDVDRISAELVERGVCSWIPLKQVCVFRGQKVLNCLFGVPKGKVESHAVMCGKFFTAPVNCLRFEFEGTKFMIKRKVGFFVPTAADNGEELRI